MNDNYQLLANPYHLKKKKSKQNDLNDQILAYKKFPYDVDKTLTRFKKLIYLIETSISNTVNDLLSIITTMMDNYYKDMKRSYKRK